jgi:hypothetical protein
MVGKFRPVITNASNAMDMAVFKAKFLLMTLNPMNTKGVFIATRVKARGRPESPEIRSEMPVAPPSMKELGMRKLSSPKAAENIPVRMKHQSFTRW